MKSKPQKRKRNKGKQIKETTLHDHDLHHHLYEVIAAVVGADNVTNLAADAGNLGVGTGSLVGNGNLAAGAGNSVGIDMDLVGMLDYPTWSERLATQTVEAEFG